MTTSPVKLFLYFHFTGNLTYVDEAGGVHDDERDRTVHIHRTVLGLEPMTL